MMLNREIGMKTGAFVSNRLSILLQITIIYITCLSALAVPYPRTNKRQFYTYSINNRHNSERDNGKQNDTIEHDRSLTYRDLFLNPYNSRKPGAWKYPGIKTEDVFGRANRMFNNGGIRTSFDQADGVMRILTLPMKDNDREIINGFEHVDPAADCLSGGLDAGVVNGALKIGIGVGLAPSCRTQKEQPSKLVPMPIFISRPVAVPVGVPQPYPVDVPRPVPIHVPVPYPAMNMGSLPMMGIGQTFPSDMITNHRDCLFQNCGESPDTHKAAIEEMMDQKYRDVRDRNEFAGDTVIPESKSI